MQTLNFPYEVKALDADGVGTFEGHAAIFGNRDHGNDIISPGAFKEFAHTADGSVRLLDQHQLARPIGKCGVTQTAAGLAIKAKLNLSVTAANDAYHLIRDGVLTGLSIGYDILSGGSEVKSDGSRVLSRLKLWECSVVTFGMNPLALITDVKSALDVADPRGFETAVRASLGLSKKQAKKLLAGGWSALVGDDEPETEAERVADKIAAMTALLRGESP